jgi:hypothetical protein
MQPVPCAIRAGDAQCPGSPVGTQRIERDVHWQSGRSTDTRSVLVVIASEAKQSPSMGIAASLRSSQ